LLILLLLVPLAMIRSVLQRKFQPQNCVNSVRTA
jgi:inner membrane protein involved in colicin E2 resistance